METTIKATRRGKPAKVKKSKQIHHYRKRDEARFWHWADQTDNLREYEAG